MKKLFLLIALLGISLSAFALETNKVYLALETGTYSYREPHAVMHLSAKKVGASFEWVGRSFLSTSGLKYSDDNSIATFELRYINGKTDYDGFTWGGTPIQDNGETDYYVEGRITIGQTYNLSNTLEFWPYMGFGYRRLVNDGTNVSASAYRRVSNYWYVPIGIKLSKDFNKQFSVTFTGEFDWLAVGKQQTDIITTGYLDNCQPEGLGLRFGLKAEVPVNKQVGLFIEPYYRMWKIQNSVVEPVWMWNPLTSSYELTGVLEPFNVTKEAGIRLGVYF